MRTPEQEAQWQIARTLIFHAIQEAWCNPPKSKPEDTFGAFLKRAVDGILALSEIEVRDNNERVMRVGCFHGAQDKSACKFGLVQVLPK